VRLETSRPLPGAIPVAALADLSLLLVAFFFLLSLHGSDSASIQLPAARSTPVSAAAAAHIVVFRRPDFPGTEAASYALSDGRGAARPVASMEALFLEVSRLTDEEPGRTFFVKADARLACAVVDDVIETLRRAGADRIVLATRSAGSGAGR